MANRELPPNGDDTTQEARPVDQEALAAEARQAEESEGQVLSVVLARPKLWPRIQRLTPLHFHNEDYSAIFQAMQRAPSPGWAPVCDYLYQQGLDQKGALVAVVQRLAETGGLQDYDDGALAQIMRAWARRYALREWNSISNLITNPKLHPIRALLQISERTRAIAEAASLPDPEASPVQSLGDLAYGYWDAVAERKNSAPTGFAELDKRMGGGLQPARLYVLLGGTGSGKTTLANQIGEHIASAGRPVFYVTSEDSPSALLAKTAARLGQVDYNAVLYGYSSVKGAIDDALALVVRRKSVDTLAYLHDTGALSLEQMQDQARAHFERFASAGPGVLVIDYLQRLARMQPGQGAQDTRDLVTRYTMALRAVAEGLGCSVLALSSMNRASYNGKGDALASAKESGDIEYTADCILALAEDEKAPAAPGHKAYALQLAKNRLGPAGEYIKLDWLGGRQQFTGA